MFLLLILCWKIENLRDIFFKKYQRLQLLREFKDSFCKLSLRIWQNNFQLVTCLPRTCVLPNIDCNFVYRVFDFLLDQIKSVSISKISSTESFIHFLAIQCRSVLFYFLTLAASDSCLILREK